MAYLDPNGAYGQIQAMGDSELAAALQPGSKSQVPASLALYELDRRRRAAESGETPKALADQSYFSNLRNPASYAQGGMVKFDSGGQVPVNSAFQLPAVPVSGFNPDTYLNGLGAVEGGNGTTNGGYNGAYSGAYQMGSGALQDTGFLRPGGNVNNPKDWTGMGGVHSREEFNASQDAQRFAAVRYAQLNAQRMQNKGVTPTPQSLAMAHGVGLGAYLKNGPNAQDGWGTQANKWAEAQNQPNTLAVAQPPIPGAAPGIQGLVDAARAIGGFFSNGTTPPIANRFGPNAGKSQPMPTQRGTPQAPVTPTPNSAVVSNPPADQPGFNTGARQFPPAPGASSIGALPMTPGERDQGGQNAYQSPQQEMAVGIASKEGRPVDPTAFDRNQFLMNAGLALAASRNPHFFQAVAQSAQEGLQTERERRAMVIDQTIKRQQMQLEAAKIMAPGDQQKLFTVLGGGDTAKGAEIFFDRSRYSPEQIASSAVSSMERDRAQSGFPPMTQDEWDQSYQHVLQSVVNGRAYQQSQLQNPGQGGITSLPQGQPATPRFRADGTQY